MSGVGTTSARGRVLVPSVASVACPTLGPLRVPAWRALAPQIACRQPARRVARCRRLSSLSQSFQAVVRDCYAPFRCRQGCDAFCHRRSRRTGQRAGKRVAPGLCGGANVGVECLVGEGWTGAGCGGAFFPFGRSVPSQHGSLATRATHALGSV